MHRNAVYYRIGSLLVGAADTRVGVLGFSALLGTVAGLGEFTLHDTLTSDPRLSAFATDVDAALIGCFVFVLTVIEMTAVRERRRRVIKDLHAVGELNHRIRNALEIIQYAAYSGSKETSIKLVNESVERIDHILKELYPVLERRDERMRGRLKNKANR